jgi:GT2 family glycosyltransferase
VIPVLIIPVLNRYDLLEQTLRSIDFPIENILIINNGTNKSFATGVRNVQILDMPSNQGIAGSWNLGIKCYPHAPYWVFGSADTHFMPGSLEKMCESSGPDYLIKSNAHYSFFSIGENIIKNVGLFDEYIYPSYFEDNDFNDRVVNAGYGDNILIPGIEVNDNGGSQTIKSDGHFASRNNFTFQRNGDYYREKVVTGDYTPKGWDLSRRRENEWN